MLNLCACVCLMDWCPNQGTEISYNIFQIKMKLLRINEAHEWLKVDQKLWLSQVKVQFIKMRQLGREEKDD